MGQISKADWIRIRRRLRSCQRAAADRIAEFLRTKPKGRSFLACLPTGAGKSGLIAVVAHGSKRSRVLVVTPRRAVCNQLVRELSGGFFQRLLSEDIKGLKKVRHLTGYWEDPGIYVATFQKLATLKDAEIAKLRRDFALVIVDEGHSEPAPVWSKIARGLEGHRIVITATPYRNDLFQFDIHPDHNFAYTFKAAVADGILTEPAFEQTASDQVVDRVRARLGEQVGIKCIVKCRSQSDVEAWKVRLEAAGFRVVAIHENFQTNFSEGFYAYVPKNLSKVDCEVIVHQRKLDEGIDLPEAKVLVLTYPVSSGRELVQTVGRVVRASSGAKAHVLDLSDSSNEGLWKSYREFDDYISKSSAWLLFIRSLDTPRLLTEYLRAFPERGYYEGGFKARFDLDRFEPKKGLEIPLASVCFIDTAHDFSLPKFCDALYWRFHKRGELVKHYERQDGFEAIVSIRFENSRLLKDQLFFQPVLEVVLVKELTGRIAVFDSRGGDHADDTELGTRAAVPVDELLKLASRSHRVRTKEVQSVAVGSTRRRAERFGMKSVDLEAVAAPQSNSSYALSTVRVDNVNRSGDTDSSYYLGMRSGRVSDQRHRKFSLLKLSAWIDDISDAFGSATVPNGGFIHSYARPANLVPTDLPRSVVFDLTGKGAAFDVDVDGVTKTLAASFVYSDAGAGIFNLSGIPVTVEYSAATERVECSSTSAVSFADGSDFFEWLNKQPIKILFDGGISYSEGSFYRVTLPTELGVDVNTTRLGGCLIGVEELQSLVRSEKGAHRPGDKYFNTAPDAFDAQSVFALLDRLRSGPGVAESVGFSALRNRVAGCDLIICTDMGTEAADFILSSPDKLCFVHVKCGDSAAPQSSAGSLAEVGGQAMKNMEHVVTKDELLQAGNHARLSRAWPSDGDVYKLFNRVRLYKGLDADAYMAANGAMSRGDFFNAVWSTVTERRASDACEKEVWLVVGRAFSRAHFVHEMAQGNRASSESLQAFQLLDGWLGLANSLDVGLRVFTSP